MAWARIVIVAAAWLASFQIVFAGPAEWDDQITSRAKNNPTAGLVFIQVKIFEDGNSTPKECRHIHVGGSSQEGERAYFAVQSLSATPENTFYAGWAILPQGVYTITLVKCGDYAGFRGAFARFAVSKGQILNLGSLVIRYKNSSTNLFTPNRPTGDWKVEDLSSAALATLKTKSPAVFAKATKQYMTPIRATNLSQ
jgi:hypothetical protein